MLPLIKQKIAEVLLKENKRYSRNWTIESYDFKNVLCHQSVKSSQKAVNNLPLDFFKVENTKIVRIEFCSFFKLG